MEQGRATAAAAAAKAGQAAATARGLRALVARAPVVAYVVLAYAFTWGVQLPLLASRRGWIAAEVAEGWEALAAFGPFVAALLVAAALQGRAGPARLLDGLRHWRVGGGWLAFSVLSPFALLAGAALVLRVATGAWPDLGALDEGRLATATGILGLVVVGGLVQGLGEEPGWRGFMLPQLRRLRGPVTATLVLFPAWLLWHLPAFLGRPEFGLGQFAGFSLGVLSAAFWLTLILERTGSVLMAVLWHTTVNVARGIAIAISTPMFLAMSTFVLAGALVIAVALWRQRPGTDRPPI
jgi:membrane protease YdiL (CAAX protease family)